MEVPDRKGCRDDPLPLLARVSSGDTSRLIAWHRELSAAHSRLRAALQLAQDSLTDPHLADPHRASRDLLLYCLGFCAALGGHHRSEDAGLFPELVGRHPELDETIAYLQQDHSMIAHLLGGLEKDVASQAPPEVIGRHLEGLAAIMESHFRYEERQLLGVLAALDLDASVPDMLGPL
jgi:hemerythrin HHE cation binding domain-containing protein